MDTKSRKQFWKTLNSLEGKDMEAESKMLGDAIKYPRHLYRFRSVSTNSLDGLRSNKLFFSSADYYDDPFDSYSHIKWNNVLKEIRQSFNDPNERQFAFGILQVIFGLTTEQISHFFNTYSNEEWGEYGKQIIERIRKFAQANELSICFTEKCLNEVLWLKYADNHHGFVMEYDMYNDSLFMCGKMTKCVSCPAANMRYPVYPIYYTNKKYNATEYIKSVVKMKSFESLPQIFQQSAINTLPNMMWQRERIILIKKKCHKYDKEWRMIYPNGCDMSNVKDRPFICWKPSSIIIGLKTNTADKNLIVACAKEAGIPRVYKCIINTDDDLDKELIYEA